MDPEPTCAICRCPSQHISPRCLSGGSCVRRTGLGSTLVGSSVSGGVRPWDRRDDVEAPCERCAGCRCGNDAAAVCGRVFLSRLPRIPAVQDVPGRSPRVLLQARRAGPGLLHRSGGEGCGHSYDAPPKAPEKCAGAPRGGGTGSGFRVRVWSKPGRAGVRGREHGFG